MKCSLLLQTKAKRGMTLIEVTLVIAILLSLISILFIGVTAYKKGTDRVFCIQNIASVQKAVRSYGNMAGLNLGDSVVDLKDQIIGAKKYLPIDPVCPAGGNYTYGGDVLPASSTLYLDCDIIKHEPKSSSGW